MYCQSVYDAITAYIFFIVAMLVKILTNSSTIKSIRGCLYVPLSETAQCIWDEKSHPACRYMLFCLIVVVNGGNRASPLVCVYMGGKYHPGKRDLSCCKQDL